MLLRAEARLFRSVLRYTLLEQTPLGEWPWLVCRSGPQGVFLSSQKSDLAVHYHRPGPAKEDLLIFRATLLAEFEGRGQTPVILESAGEGQGRARWDDDGIPQTRALETAAPNSLEPFPEIPARFSPFPVSFRQALTDAVASTARDNVRFLLNRIQILGKHGEMAATDGKQMLLQGGFRFPFRDDFLVPRLPVLTHPRLLPDGPFAVGRTNTHLGLRLGPWLFLLRSDSKGRYPNVRGIIPDPRKATCTLALGDQGAGHLLRILPRLPGADADQVPITLDLHGRVILRAQGGEPGTVTEIEVPGAHAAGRPTLLNLNRQVLLRALHLGFRQLEVIDPTQPVVCRGKDRLFMWLPLDPKAALGPGTGRVPAAATNNRVAPAPIPTQQPRSDDPMARHTHRGHHNGDPRNGDPQPTPNGPPETTPEAPNQNADLLAEAEALRQLLQEAQGRLGRLIGALRQDRRQRRIFSQAVASLRHLNLPG